MYKKRGQATGAAILVAVIAVLIVLYILFLPPEERQELLEEAEEGENGITTYDFVNKTLLDEIPGRLDFIAKKDIEHSMPTINLNILAESTVIKEVDSVYVGKSWFGQEKAIINFSIDNPEDIEELILNFKVRESKGRLKIAINGYKIFDSEIKTINIQPIKLTDYILKENSLEITVSSPGVAFWSTNHYVLEDVKVIGDVLSREGQESRNVFILTSAEKNNLE
ncbi:hypothetical protein KY317_04035, partial [Candidatus Woesearchaeota archaeon]|nr:hypothetical protein [Candidatus Woesearchaeota archaeon]